MMRWGMRRSKTIVMRLQIVAIMLAIAIIATVTSLNAHFSGESPEIIKYTAIGCVVASLFGFHLIRTVKNYPGVEQFFYIVPAFCVSYGVFLAVLIMARIPYSRSLLTGSFVVSIIVFFIVHALTRKHLTLEIGVVTNGDYQRLIGLPGANWRLLGSTNAPVPELDAVAVDLYSDLSDEWERKLASFALRGLPVYHSKHLWESMTGKVEIEQLSENTFGTLTPLQSYLTIKMIGDWVGALIVAVLAAPLLILTALAIRFDSPGPAIFRQKRVGYRGIPFTMYKFRTMTFVAPVADQSQMREAAMTQASDKRVTRLGRFLRRSRLDELPQLFNVLKGDMSWIGPRPEADVLSRWYESEIPFYHYRHIVRPGITGWAQVHQGHVSDMRQVREKLNFDFYYIKHFSLWVDIIVIGRTIRTMMNGFGSR